MGASYTFEPPFIILRGEGEYPARAVMDCLVAALDDPACPPSPRLIFDVSSSAALPTRPSHEIADIARHGARFADRFGRRIAVVVGSTAAYGLARMGAVHSEFEGAVAEVFTDHDEARKWLLS